jgi:glycosyltransferase involved in cell wall biosynthesis
MVTFHFPPSAASGSHRLLGFARHLPRHGWRSVIVSPPTTPHERVDENLAKQIPREAPVYYVPFRMSGLLRPVRAFANRVAFSIDWYFWSRRMLAAAREAIRVHHPAAILTSGPPHEIHLIGASIHREFGLPWIADFRDPWVATSGKEGDRSWWTRVDRRREASVMRDAQLIIANAPLACEQLKEAFPEHSAKMVAVTNGFDPEVFVAMARGDPHDRATRIVHAGQLYQSRWPRDFLTAIRDLVDEPPAGLRPLEVELLGDLKSQDSPAEQDIRERKLENVVRVRGQVPYVQSLREMMSADILLLLDTPARRIGVPAKLYEYLGTGRPILALGEADGDLAWVLRESGGVYRLVPPDNPSAIKQAIVELARASPAELSVMPRGESKFTRSQVAARLAGLLDGLTDSSSSSAVLEVGAKCSMS